MKQSNSLGYLKGKTYPGHSGTVKDVRVDGNVRIVTLSNGTTIRTTKKTLFQNLTTVLSQHQAAVARQSMRVKANGLVNVTIGGKIKGERKSYANKAAAKAAITRHYGAGIFN